MALDYGMKRVGVAVSDETKTFSFARDTLPNDQKLFGRLLDFIKSENVNIIVLGYPLRLNSQPTDSTTEVINFKSVFETFLEKNSFNNTKIVLFDERFTSSLAASYMLESGISKKQRRNKELIDSGAARILLEDYLRFVKNQSTSNL